MQWNQDGQGNGTLQNGKVTFNYDTGDLSSEGRISAIDLLASLTVTADDAFFGTCNWTNTMTVPSGVKLLNVLRGSQVVTFPQIAANDFYQFFIDIPQVAAGDFPIVSFPAASMVNSSIHVFAWCDTDTVGIRVLNLSSNPIQPIEGTVRVAVLKTD